MASVQTRLAQSPEFDSHNGLAILLYFAKLLSGQRSPTCCHNTVLNWDYNVKCIEEPLNKKLHY